MKLEPSLLSVPQGALFLGAYCGSVVMISFLVTGRQGLGCIGFTMAMADFSGSDFRFGPVAGEQ